MGVYTAWKDGYKIEEVWGTSLIVDEDSIAYNFGPMSKEAIHPSPECSIVWPPPGVNEVEIADNTAIGKSQFTLPGMYNILPLNGVLLWLAMGKSATTEVGGVYTHAITVPAAVAGVIPPLPSVTIEHELTGTATEWDTQFKGCKVSRLSMSCSYKQRALTFLVDWLAKTATKTAFNLVNDMDLPATAVESPYMFVNMTRTFDGGDIAGLSSMQLDINNDIFGEYATTYTGATYDGMWPFAFTESYPKMYELTLEYTPGSSTLWDEAVATGNTKNIIFKWTRSANDYIQITCTDCHFKSHSLTTPEKGKPLTNTVKIEVRSVTISVKDTIAGGAYGE